MQRRNSDLIETGLRKRTLTHTSSVNLPRTLETARTLSSSNGNLARSMTGSITNLTLWKFILCVRIEAFELYSDEDLIL